MKRKIRTIVSVQIDRNPVIDDLYRLSIAATCGLSSSALSEIKAEMVQSWSWAEWRRYQASCRFKWALRSLIFRMVNYYERILGA